MSKQCVRSSLRPRLCLCLTRRRVRRQQVSGLRNWNRGVWGHFYNHPQIPLVISDAAQGRKNRAMLRERKKSTQNNKQSLKSKHAIWPVYDGRKASLLQRPEHKENLDPVTFKALIDQTHTAEQSWFWIRNEKKQKQKTCVFL